jgi:hypothetical protein
LRAFGGLCVCCAGRDRTPWRWRRAQPFSPPVPRGGRAGRALRHRSGRPPTASRVAVASRAWPRVLKPAPACLKVTKHRTSAASASDHWQPPNVTPCLQRPSLPASPLACSDLLGCQLSLVASPACCGGALALKHCPSLSPVSHQGPGRPRRGKSSEFIASIWCIIYNLYIEFITCI